MQPRHFFILATAIGTWLGHANPLVQLPLAALLLPAGLMVLGQGAASWRDAFKQAWLAGSLACLGCLYWVFWPVEHFGGVHWLLAAPVPVLLSLAMGAYFGLFGLAAHLGSRRLGPLTGLFFLGLTWTLMELAVATLLTGFPWLTLSAAFVPWTIVVLPAADIGAYGLSGVLALVACGGACGAVPGRGSRSCALVSVAEAVDAAELVHERRGRGLMRISFRHGCTKGLRAGRCPAVRRARRPRCRPRPRSGGP